MSSTGSCRVMLRPPTSFWAFGTHAGLRGTRSRKRVNPVRARLRTQDRIADVLHARNSVQDVVGPDRVASEASLNHLALHAALPGGRVEGVLRGPCRIPEVETPIQRSVVHHPGKHPHPRRKACGPEGGLAVDPPPRRQPVSGRPAGQGGDPPLRAPLGGGRMLRSSGAATE